MNILKSVSREGAKWAKLGMAMVGLALLAAPVQAAPPKIVVMPTFTTVVAASQITNTIGGAAYTNTNPQLGAIAVVRGEPIALTIRVGGAWGSNCNFVVGFSPSVDGTNYGDNPTNMWTVTQNATGGAHTNRVVFTNFSAAMLAGYNFLSIRHYQNVNTNPATVTVTAGAPQ